MTRCGAPDCGKPLSVDGPSLYFCDDRCQRLWQAAQGDPLSPPIPQHTFANWSLPARRLL